jgi:mono/diheme cytochrome c family protein
VTSRRVSRACVVALLAWLCAVSTRPMDTPARAQGPDIGTEAQRESGKVLYAKYCAQCHGDKGDGEGYATVHLNPRPRDFTSGRFKVRTTPNGSLPTHQDLVNIIRRGMPYTSMPAWPTLTDQEVSDLAYYLTTFSADFTNPERVAQPVELPSGPAATAESIELGKKLYEETGCLKCHGNLGLGDGPSAPTLQDDFGRSIRAADLSHPWTFRGGPTREDIFRTMSTGFNGTPMPSFTDSLSAEQRWAITDFIVSLSKSSEPGYTNLVVAKPSLDPIDLAKGAELFAAAPVARLPIIGQIIEQPRAFHPPTTSVTVQAIYDTESVALLVRWHDMGSEKTGTNGPSLPVPPEEEEEPQGGAAAPEGGGFGDLEVAEPVATDPFAEPDTPAAGAPSEFSDAVAVQIPSQVPTSARKPYFIFGDSANSVDLWFYDLARAEPQQFTGRGSADIQPNDTGDITGVASYDQGEWSVIFKRPLRPSAGAPLTPSTFLPIAFSVWDGFSRERGNRRGLTSWYSIYLEPEVVTSAVGPMVRTGLLILVIELVIIGWVRWSRRSAADGLRARGDADGTRQPATSV